MSTITRQRTFYQFKQFDSPRIQVLPNVANSSSGETYIIEIKSAPVSSLWGQSLRTAKQIRSLSDENYILRRPLVVNIEMVSDGVLLGSKYPNVRGFGQTIAEAQSEWEATLLDLFDDFEETPDNELTADGLALKNTLLNVIVRRHVTAE